VYEVVSEVLLYKCSQSPVPYSRAGQDHKASGYSGHSLPQEGGIIKDARSLPRHAHLAPRLDPTYPHIHRTDAHNTVSQTQERPQTKDPRQQIT